MALSHINGVSLDGLSVADASVVVEREMGDGPVRLRFVTQKQKDLDGGRVPEEADPWSVHWADDLQFGDVVRPQTAMFTGFPEPMPQFGPPEKLKLCLYERVLEACTRETPAHAEDPITGTGKATLIPACVVCGVMFL